MPNAKPVWLLAAAAGLIAGAAGGWVGGRVSVPAPPPPVPFRNPLADARVDESLLLESVYGVRTEYRVLAVYEDSVLLRVTTDPPPPQPRNMREIRVARSYFGFFVILDGDVDAAAAEATSRDFVLHEVVPDTLEVPNLGRSIRCWKVTGSHRTQETMTHWISDEVSVHGLLRSDGPRGKVWEVKATSEGR